MRRYPLLLILPVLAACSGPRTVDGFRDATFDGRVTHVLVLLPGLFPEASEYARERFVVELERRGIRVSTRSDFFAASERLTRERLIAVVRESDVDGVLLVDTAGMTRESRGKPSFADARGNMGEFETEISFLLSQGGSVPPTYRETQTEVDLRLRLFPEATLALAWESFVRFPNPGSTFDLIDQASTRLAREVARSGMVATGG